MFPHPRRKEILVIVTRCLAVAGKDSFYREYQQQQQHDHQHDDNRNHNRNHDNQNNAIIVSKIPSENSSDASEAS